jgi:1-acyl-sn-glycerol-3-phosphate acyltransferase
MHSTIFDVPVLRHMLQGLSLFYLRITGWRREGRLPDLPQYIVIAAPHTSNWDFPITLALAFAYKMKMRWMGKNSLFRWPFGGVMKWLGGIPIDRSKSHDVVAQCIRVFKERAKMVMVIPPEGTRKKVHYWKTGFYYIAKGANVPIVLGFLDYLRKVGGFGPTFMPTGDIEADMKTIQAFYAGVTGKHPDKSSLATVASKGE